MNNWTLYLLENSVSKRTYLGITNDLEKRIKKHNGELSGGAKYTRAFKGNGKWVLYCYVDRLTKQKAFSYEKLIRNKKIKFDGSNAERRKKIMEMICGANDVILI